MCHDDSGMYCHNAMSMTEAASGLKDLLIAYDRAGDAVPKADAVHQARKPVMTVCPYKAPDDAGYENDWIALQTRTQLLQ